MNIFLSGIFQKIEHCGHDENEISYKCFRDIKHEDTRFLFCVEVHCETKIVPTERGFFSPMICQFCVNMITFQNFFPKCSSGHLEIVFGNIGGDFFAQSLNKNLKNF